jgi:hemerythrin superfamily protein
MATTKRTTKQAAPTSVKRAVKRTAKKAAKKVSSSAAAKRSRKVAKKAPAAKKAAVKTAKRKTATRKTATRKTATRKTATRKTATRKVAVRKAATRPGRGTAGDAIALLKGDHREVEQLFKRFERAGSGAHRAKGQLVASMIEALSRHAEIEELVFYPAVREQMPKSEPDVLEALEEHHLVKVVLRELESLDPSAERFDAKVTVMMEAVRHHVKEEENDLFPKVRSRIDRRELVDMGDALRRAKRVVPTRPHPAAPDTPPGNVVAGAAVAVIDRARTVGKRAVDRVMDEIPSR